MHLMSPLQDLPPNTTLAPSLCTPECHQTQALLHLKLSSIQIELADLQSRYDDLLRVKERAETRYRSDYKKWKDFKVWLFDSNKKFKDSRRDMTGEGKRVLGLPRAGSAKDGTDQVSLSRSAADLDKGGFKEPQEPVSVLQVSSAGNPPSSISLVAPSPMSPARPSSTVVASRAPDASLSRLTPSRRPFERITKSASSTKTRSKAAVDIPSQHSSETEQEPSQSQPMLVSKVAHTVQPLRLVPIPTPLPKHVTTQIKHQLEPKTHYNDRRRDVSFLSELDTRPNKWRRLTEEGDSPGFAGAAFGRVEGIKDASEISSKGKKRMEDYNTPNDFAKVRGLDDSDKQKRSDRPYSKRRVDDSVGDRQMNPPTSMDLPALTASKSKGTTDTSSSKQRNVVGCSTKRPTYNAALTSASKRPPKDAIKQPLDRYAEYKGRGRYAQDKPGDSSNTTINAQYMIDKTRNGGLDFQYDAVVRNREQRKQMHAGDCDCCRDYYEAIGPLPPRLQPPLWASPPSTPIPASSSSHHPQENLAIESHKAAISRHRYDWDRAKTPPGYWNIGFPDTQEVVGINEKAKEMHRKKREMVEKEANKENGRYRKR